jgi:hypothetical protein
MVVDNNSKVPDVTSISADSTSEPSIQTQDPIPTTSLPIDEISTEMDIQGIRVVNDDTFSHRIIGLVRNNSDFSITNVKVAIQVFNTDGELIIDDIVSTALTSLVPGSSSPFVLWLQEPPPSNLRLSASVIDYTKAEFQRTDVKTRQQYITIDDNNDIHITGEIINNTLYPVQLVSFAAAVCNTDGDLLTTNSQSVFTRYLGPGEVSPYRVTMHRTGKNSTDLLEQKVYIDARIVNPEDYQNIEINNNLNQYKDRFGEFHLVGEITNHSKNKMNVGLVAGIYDSKGFVIDVATTRLALNSIYPGESLPFDFNTWGPLSYKKGALELAETFSVQWDPFLSWPNELNYARLKLEIRSLEINPTHGIFKGKLINETDFDVSSTVVIARIYDQDTGNILATKDEEFITLIPPGGEYSYQLVVEYGESINPEFVDILIDAYGTINQ